MDSIPSFVSLRSPTFYSRIFSPSLYTGPTHSLTRFISQPKHRFSFQCIAYYGLAVNTDAAPEKSRVKKVLYKGTRYPVSDFRDK